MTAKCSVPSENFPAPRTALLLAKKILEESFDEKISQKSLCRKTGLNDYKLKKGFKALFGVSIRDFHLSLKMEHAKKMLGHSKDKISSVAYALGYQHAHNFSIAFKKQFGVSPKGFRKIQKTGTGNASWSAI